MVVTRKCKDPANKPPPHFCPMPACTEGGGDLIAGFYGIKNNLIKLKDEVGMAVPKICSNICRDNVLYPLYIPTPTS